MFEGYKSTLKSTETEDLLDLYVIRPVCYLFACLFAKLDIHPNTVTIWSMFVGAGSAYFFAQGCLYYEGTWGLMMNLIAMFMLMLADIFDCVDGQLARMTGKKSPMGRVLDGVAGFTWFGPIYVAMVYRFYVYHDIEFSFLGIEDTTTNVIIATIIVFILGVISGLWGLARQQRLADYYIQAHLFFLKGEKGAELDNSVQQQKKYDEMPASASKWERLFQSSYVDYTRKQEGVTPMFQKLLATIKEKYGDVSNVPADLKEEFHKESLAIQKWNGLLTFNFRTAFLFLFILLDLPAEYFVWEIVGMSLLCYYVNRRHERLCRKLVEKA